MADEKVDDVAVDAGEAKGDDGGDGSEFYEVKMALLEVVNAQRAEAGLPAVEFDAATSAPADAHCNAMIEGGYISHVDLNGLKPYHRYCFAGIRDHVTENVSGVDAGDGVSFEVTPDSVKALALEAHEKFMKQNAPQDANKLNVLGKHHTHMAIGLAITEESFRLVEVFVDRYVSVPKVTPAEESAPPLEFASDETYLVAKALADHMDVVACTVYYEPIPQAITAADASRIEGYDDYTPDKAAVAWPWEMARLPDGSLRIPIFLSSLQAGLYYVQVHVRDTANPIPYDAPSEDLDITSSDVVTATGIIVECSPEKAAAFQEAQQATEAHLADDALSDAGMGTAVVEPFSEITVIRASDPTPTGFRRQQIHELGSFGNALGGAGAAAGGDAGVHIAMSLNPALPHISQVAICGGKGAMDTPDPPAGYEAVPVNLRSLVGAQGASLYLCVKRVSDKSGSPPLLDAGLAVFASGDVPLGYTITDTDVALSADGSALLAVCQSADPDAASSALATAQEAVRTRAQGGGQGGYGQGMEWGDGADEMDDAADDELRREEERARVYAMLRDSMQEHDQIMAQHSSLERRLAALFAARKPDDEKDDAKTSDMGGDAMREEKEKRYQDTLAQVIRSKDELHATQSSFDAIAMDLQAQLDEKEAKASEIQESFVDFKREIAKAAENSRTGKPIPRRIIAQFEATEAAKDQEVEKVRLKNIHLRTQLRKLNDRLKEREKLADGLHLIDFEQLKIENQTLNEKIEERHEELHKLRKKTTTTVQVLTHIKEKLQFVEAKAEVLKKELGGLEEQVTHQRDTLSKAKHTRDELRGENDRLRQQQGFVNNDRLVLDFERLKKEMRELRATKDELQRRREFLSTQGGRSRTMNASAEMTPAM